MRAYHNLPEATAEVLDPQRWLHTGDIGHVDDQGFLFITDRKKDLIKTSGGKFVAPQAIEGKLKAICPYVSQVVVHGDNRNFCVALITLEEQSVRAWAEQRGVRAASFAELTAHERVRGLVQGCVDELNRGLASYESIRKFAILPEDLSIESGELTPSLKVKRKVVADKYKHHLDAHYTG